MFNFQEFLFTFSYFKRKYKFKPLNEELIKTSGNQSFRARNLVVIDLRLETKDFRFE